MPEDILFAKIVEAGGLENVAEIRVPDKNHITIILKDGAVREIAWAHQSRRQSWTPEMREAARQKSLERSKNRHET